MILTTLPDVPPRPATDANSHFRRWFYSRWGHENTIICGQSRHVEFAARTHTLSIKATWGGSERYHLPQRDVVVDDDNVLILNEGCHYGSVLRGQRPAFSFAVFFAPGLQDEALAQRARTLSAMLESPDAGRAQVRFSEHLRGDAPALQARLRAMRDAACAGESAQDWLDEQCQLLLGEMLALEVPAQTEAPTRRSAQLELQRRLRLAADFIESNHAESVTLAQMAAVACLSPYHFVRRFGAAFGITPHAYLVRKRARVAERLLAARRDDADSIALLCGFGSRSAMRRALRVHRRQSAISGG